MLIILTNIVANFVSVNKKAGSFSNPGVKYAK